MIHTDERPSGVLFDLLRAAHRLLLIAGGPSRHRRVATCFRAVTLAAYTARQPQLPFKYLRRNYLATTLDRSQRAAILVFHFDYLLTRFGWSTVEALPQGGVILWSGDGTRRHAVRWSMADPVDNEGELALTYELDGEPISVLSFTFVPALLLDRTRSAVTLVSRVQTVAADTDLLRAAAKDFGDVAPRFALMAVLQGLLLALGQRVLVAVSLANQTVARSNAGSLSSASYDALFAALGGRLGPAGFYRLSLPYAEAEPAQATASHRRRARARRARRQAITEQARRVADGLLASSGDHAPAQVSCGGIESTTSAPACS